MLNVQPEDFDSIAADVNARMSPISSQHRTLSRIEHEKEEAEKALLMQKPKKGRGRPKGSKSSKTAGTAVETEKPEKPKGKPGRPKGSRNKKSLELMKKHRIGRPPGSKNKPKQPTSWPNIFRNLYRNMGNSRLETTRQYRAI